MNWENHIDMLEEYVSVSSLAPLKDNNGWEFNAEYSDPLKSRRYLYQVYQDAKTDYSGRISVPVLWDKKYSGLYGNKGRNKNIRQ